MSRIAVTGASGFIGGWLVPLLIQAGHSVLVIHRPHSKPDWKNVSFAEIDGNPVTMATALAANETELLIHLASLFLASHQSSQVQSLIEANVAFGCLMLEACALSGVKKIITTGTAWQSLGSRRNIAVNLYAATKQAFDSLARYYSDVHEMHVLALRLCDTYGPNDTRRKVVQLLIEASQTGIPLDMSPGEQQLSLLHVSDVCRGYLQAIANLMGQKEVAWQEFALRSDRLLSLRELVSIVGAVCGRLPDIRWGAKPYRDREVFIPEQDTPLLPNWTPVVPLEQGLGELVP